jgi:hypothetical protein
MFMFRLINYMYDLKHRTAPFSLGRALAYFFMLPNVCFVLFPVVDYKTMWTTYHNDNRIGIYQVGLRWMLRGIIQLVLYRVLYHYLLIEPASIRDAGDVFRFMVTTYLLYLRVSGDFHLIIGLMHLFGFNLSESHHMYLLSSSFNDFWRRINIYWKDFLLKVFYRPTYFRLKHLGTGRAMVFATVFSFVVTWLLHSYQWFWLRGQFPITGQDAVFWTILCILVAVNSLYEARYGRRRSLAKQTRSFRAGVGIALRTIGTFVVICTLWSVWTYDSFSGWFAVMAQARHVSLADAGLILGSLVVIGVSGAVLGHSTSERTEAGAASISGRPPLRFWRSAITVTCVGAAMYALSRHEVHKRLPTHTAGVVQRLTRNTLNVLDEIKLTRGYYEDLTGVTHANFELWSLLAKQQDVHQPIYHTALARRTGDFFGSELIASSRDVYKGATVTINHWGMRDRDYTRAKPPGTYRIMLVGASTAMGWGVGLEETFENLVEDRLNADPPDPGFTSYEILNLSVPSYFALQKLRLAEERAFQFEPDALYIVMTTHDVGMVNYHLYTVVKNDIEIPYEPVRDILRRAGASKHMTDQEFWRRVEPHVPELIGFAYRRLADVCRSHEVDPVMLLIPFLKSKPKPGAPALDVLARENGLDVFDLSDVFQGVPEDSLLIDPWDRHPNPQGHRMIAERLEEHVRSHIRSDRSGPRSGGKTP